MAIANEQQFTLRPSTGRAWAFSDLVDLVTEVEEHGWDTSTGTVEFEIETLGDTPSGVSKITARFRDEN